MSTATRNAPLEARKPRLSLEGWRGRNTAQPASEPDDDSAIVDPIQRWESWLWAERNTWSIERRQRERLLKVGLFGSAVQS